VELIGASEDAWILEDPEWVAGVEGGRDGLGRALTADKEEGRVRGLDLSGKWKGEALPASVARLTALRKLTMRDCKSLKSVADLPASVTQIGEEAFRGCASLASITLPESVTQIGEQAFLGCTSLASITIPESVTQIGGQAFLGCTSLASITSITVEFVRFRTTRTRLPSCAELQIAQLVVFDALGTALILTDATNPGGVNPPNEEPAKALDGTPTTKWLDARKGALECRLAKGSAVLGKYMLMTANDCPERDPIRWVLEGPSLPPLCMHVLTTAPSPLPTGGCSRDAIARPIRGVSSTTRALRISQCPPPVKLRSLFFSLPLPRSHHRPSSNHRPSASTLKSPAHRPALERAARKTNRPHISLACARRAPCDAPEVSAATDSSGLPRAAAWARSLQRTAGHRRREHALPGGATHAPRTRGRPRHAHTCGAAFGMRGVSGMPRVSGRAWLRGDGGKRGHVA